MIGDWLNLITNIPNEKMRETLYNIESFRQDAVGIGQEPIASGKQANNTKPEGKPLAAKGIN
jgi:hypothetical protein